jgi:molybdenum cofactor synthesis domain-containing protein
MLKNRAMFSVGIITVSDQGFRGQRQDESGQVIRNTLSAPDSRVLRYQIVPDEVDVISGKLSEWADGGDIDVILTTGGTGLAKRDVTPEATLAVVDKVVPGLAEAMRVETARVTQTAILSRAVAGVRGRCLIINLPGSPRNYQR